MENIIAQNWIAIGAVTLILIGAAVAVWAWRRQQSRKLRDRFGEEYDRIVGKSGRRSKAEAILKDRQRRVGRLDIRPLSASERSRFTSLWNDIQAQFVDTPQLAVFEADRLVTEVMRARGYPTDRFEDRIDDVSVDYPYVISSYREACRIVSLQERGQATTEDQRRAMVLYRDLFDELLDERGRYEELRRAS